MIITAERELGKWTVRVNGIFVANFWREIRALRLAERLRVALDNPSQITPNQVGS